MVEMHTFKEGTGWNAEQWPEATTGTAAITRWHYDEATGLLMSKEYDDGKEVSYSYTTGGKLETRTWARLNNGNPLVTTYGYDPNTGELTSIDYSDSTQDIAFTYDRLGRQKTITDSVGSRVFGYNSQLQQETETITGLYNKVITRTYETAGVTGRATGFNLGAGYSVTYGYEAGTGRFRSVAWTVNGVNDTATYSYLPNSDLLHQLTTNSGQLTTYSYEPNRNLKTQVENQFNSQLISQYDYTYNTLGLREHSDTGGQAFTGTPIEPTPETSTYMTNSLNQYTQITKNDGQQTTDTLTYDDDGNLTSIITADSTKTYKYNAENRLVSVEPATPVNGDKKVEFVYDYMGRRVQKKVYTYESSVYSLQSIHLFFYDGWNMIQEMDGTGVVQKSYLYGMDLSQSVEGAGGVGGLLSVVDSGETYHFLYDANGNVEQLIDSDDGSIDAHYEYDPFGVMLKSYGTMKDANPFRFSTKYYDVETDLYYYGYRYYSPSLGRWISRDPSEEKGGNNLYGFVGNDPLNQFDFLGLWKRDSSSGDIWIAESGDSLSSLAMKAEYGSNASNWSCIWPVGNTKDHGYPNKIWPCDKYDASNLASPSSNSLYLQLIGDSALATSSYNSIFPGASLIQGNQVASRIASVSQEGATPIELFVLAGHGGAGGTVNGIKSYFRIADLLALNQASSFSRAQQKKGPVRCWFTRNATARFSGCSSQGFAQDFANNVLRIGATAIGTTMTIGTSVYNGSPLIWWGYNSPSGPKYGPYYSSPVWSTFPGRL
jgi:RHS repeat-associated protein